MSVSERSSITRGSLELFVTRLTGDIGGRAPVVGAEGAVGATVEEQPHQLGRAVLRRRVQSGRSLASWRAFGSAPASSSMRAISV